MDNIIRANAPLPYSLPNIILKIFLEKNESGGDNDLMVLHDFKIMTSDENGHQYETGYFAPWSFWDRIYDYKLV